MDTNGKFTQFSLPGYSHEVQDGQGSQMKLTLGSRQKSTRRRRKKGDGEPTFIVPHTPSPKLTNPSCASYSMCPPTPVQLSYIGLDEPFASPDRAYQYSLGYPNALFNNSYSPNVNTHSNLSWSPDTPSLVSSFSYDPTSSPEISTPSLKWKRSSSDNFNGKSTHKRHKTSEIWDNKLSKSLAALKALDELKVSPFDLINTILDPESSKIFQDQQNSFFRCDSTIIPRILSRIFENDMGYQIFLQWLPENFIRDQFCTRISQQMEAAKPFFHMNTQNFSIDFLETFDLQRNIAQYVSKNLADWMYALKAATGSLESPQKEAETEIGRLVMTCQAMNFRSLQCSQLQYLLGMYASSTGTSVRTIQVLDAAGLSFSHPTILKTIDTIADQVVNLARELTFEPHNFTYDNIDMSGSIHVEQTKDAVAKVRSGCFCLIYCTVGVKDRKHMLLAPILQNLQKAIPLTWGYLNSQTTDSQYFEHTRPSGVPESQSLIYGLADNDKSLRLKNDFVEQQSQNLDADDGMYPPDVYRHNSIDLHASSSPIHIQSQSPPQTVNPLPVVASTYPMPPRSPGPTTQSNSSWDLHELLWDLIEKQEEVLGLKVNWCEFTREQDGDNIVHQIFQDIQKSAPNDIPLRSAFSLENDVRKTHICVANLMLRLSYRLLRMGGHESDLENTNRLAVVTRVLAGVITVRDLVTIERDTRNFIDIK
ncbi:hypothetical protein BDP27DRAFT_1425924 [Rhodocollybia butyracea]|uniref:Uncharacterized protein n=1 Tax=Rhodocollybia butyracea TaxID=206335 RepID=A0A9P5U392_9AGAR|nr:hypothetical protein BDP27DRAFT_1425924 [Rhodocollybia butyracea]